MYKVVEDLVADDLDHLERRVRRDRVDEHVPVDADEVLGVEDRVLVLFSERVSLPPEIPGTMLTRKRKETYLTSRIDNLRREVLSLIPDLLAERVLDGRVITFYEMPVHVAHGQRRFSCWEGLLVTCRTLRCLDAFAGTGRARLLELAASARGRLAALRQPERGQLQRKPGQERKKKRINLPTERDPTIAILRCLVPGGIGAACDDAKSRRTRRRGEGVLREGNCDRADNGDAGKWLSVKGFALLRPGKVGGEEGDGEWTRSVEN